MAKEWDEETKKALLDWIDICQKLRKTGECTYCEATQSALAHIETLESGNDLAVLALCAALCAAGKKIAELQKHDEKAFDPEIVGTLGYWRKEAKAFEKERDEARKQIRELCNNRKAGGREVSERVRADMAAERDEALEPKGRRKPEGEKEQLIADIVKFLAPCCDDRIEFHVLLKRAKELLEKGETQ